MINRFESPLEIIMDRETILNFDELVELSGGVTLLHELFKEEAGESLAMLRLLEATRLIMAEDKDFLDLDDLETAHQAFADGFTFTLGLLVEELKSEGIHITDADSRPALKDASDWCNNLDEELAEGGLVSPADQLYGVSLVGFMSTPGLEDYVKQNLDEIHPTITKHAYAKFGAGFGALIFRNIVIDLPVDRASPLQTTDTPVEDIIDPNAPSGNLIPTNEEWAAFSDEINEA